MIFVLRSKEKNLQLFFFAVNGCTKIEEPQIFPVHYGWPYKIQCSLIFEINGARDLLESLYDYYYEEENEENIWVSEICAANKRSLFLTILFTICLI